MTTTFAAQLRTIAANSTNELDLRARREAHAESVIFERNVAVKQDWETLYQICVEGYQELCVLDPRLREFDQNLYSPHSKTQDREQWSKSQNEALGLVLERCLALLGAKATLRPAIKAVEWLVRRFRVHVYNTGALLATFLPYHETPVFRNILSIIPANKISGEWKFLGPYHKVALNVPRHSIVYTATNNDAFFSFLNNHTLRVCQEGAASSQLLRFWGSVTVEAVTGRLSQVKSGRKEVQRQRLEDVLLKILPLVSEGLEIKDCAELTLTCFTVSLVVAGEAELEDRVLDSLLRSIAPFITNSQTDSRTALACASILVAKKSVTKVSRDVLDVFQKAKNLESLVLELKGQLPLLPLFEALMSSALSGLKSSNLDSRLDFVERTLAVSPELFEPSNRSRLLAVLLNKLRSTDTTSRPEHSTRRALIALLQRLNDSSDFTSAFPEALSLTGWSQADVEALLGGTIAGGVEVSLIEPKASSTDAIEDVSASASSSAEEMLASLPSTATELSFLATKRSALFEQLGQAFSLCRKNDGLQAQFENLPIWRQNSEAPSELHTSFLLRVACGPLPVADRVAALGLLARALGRGSRDHSQLLIPYFTVLLADPAQAVRRSTVTCLMAIPKCLERSSAAEEAAEGIPETIYDAVTMTNVKTISSAQALKLLGQVYLPNLEECILDSACIHNILGTAFDSSRTLSTGTASMNIDLKKSLRTGLFDLLTGCALSTPLLRVKVGTLQLLAGVHKVGTMNTSKILTPVLESWATLSQDEAQAAADLEGLALSEIDTWMFQIVSVQGKEAVEKILRMLLESKAQLRPELTKAFFDRIAAIWKEMRPESQISMAVRLFDMAFSEEPARATGSRHVLHSTTLSTDVLATLIEHAHAGLAEMQTEIPRQKRRRLSHGRESLPKEMAVEFDAMDSRLTFALELVEDSKPESHPQLLGHLFELLIVMRRLKDKTASESPYLLNLCLSCILAIIDKAKESRRPNIDMASIRADLVTDCIRASDNPQVQGTALLLSSSLASLAPDRILHTIMPIFTFMGKSLLSKDDERSIYVTNRAIDQIIPPLVSSLKKQDAQNLVHATSSLLSSFVTAHDHIPHHRRVTFYQRLLGNLGADDFAFALISLFASRRHPQDMSEFFSGLLADLPAATQLLTFRKVVDLVKDVFADAPHDAEPLLDITRSTSQERRVQQASVLLETASQLLEPRRLKAQVKQMQQRNDPGAQAFWTEFKICLSNLLSLLRDQKARRPELAPQTRQCLGSLLRLPSVAELLQIMPDTLQEMERVGDHELPPLALRVLAGQLQHHAPKDSMTQSDAMSFLPIIEKVIRTTQDDTFRHAAITCLDRIIEAYGRKTPDSVVSAASTLIDGECGLGSTDSRTQIMSLLCLASMVEIIGEAAVSIVVQSMPQVLRLLQSSLKGDVWNAELHNAAFTLISSFISHVPFVISDENVVQTLQTAYRSCAANLDASCQESREETLSLVAQKLDLATVVSSLNQAWQATALDDVQDEATAEFLHLLSQAIERNSKSTVARSADAISTLILQILDLRRRVGSSTTVKIDQIEATVNDLSIAFIYKLNDTAFRPLFEEWVDWATKLPDLPESEDEESARTARLTSFCSLATHFFATLKSIVTSYASYILPPVNATLRSMSEFSPSSSSKAAAATAATISDESIRLYKSTLSLLATAARHDADGFFTSPSHFQPLCANLVAQLDLAASRVKSLRPLVAHQVIPCIVALATATLDTPAHHHTINHLLCQLRHHPSAAVRLASIKTQVALTDSEDVGEDWINNVVMGQTSADGGLGGSGETMVYVNEMLEDDDEEVEREVRGWVRRVRDVVGEDIFEV